MNLFTRITASLHASADKVVGQFENHEAIASTALASARHAMFKVRSRQKTLQRTGEEIQDRINEQTHKMEQWTQRALRLASEDEAKALECLEHKQRCKQRVQELEKAQQQHLAIEASSLQKLQAMESRLQAMQRQHDELRSRESLAQASAVMNRIGPDSAGAVDDVFERWETSISSTEIHNEPDHTIQGNVSSLDYELTSQEQQTALKSELQELISASGESHVSK